MPNWKTHIEIAKRINNKLRFTNNELEEFMIGNILADINNGFIVNNISSIHSHDYTHYEEDNGISYINFYNKYKDKLKEPIVLGYYIHLYTDYLWNNNFYTKIKNNAKFNEYTAEQLKRMKHNDFKLYNNLFSNNTIFIYDIDNIVKKSKMINKISINSNDINEVINFLNKKTVYKSNFKIYTIDELNYLMEDTINLIIKQIEICL